MVEVQFNGNRNTPSSIQGTLRPESSVYEEMFGKLLINPQTAKQWRSSERNAVPRGDLSGSDALSTFNSPLSLPGAPASTTPRYKVIITSTGMYHITASDLATAGVDVSTIRPSTLALSNGGKQIPIFVRHSGNSKPVNDNSGFGVDGEIVFYAQRHSGEKHILIHIPMKMSIGLHGMVDRGSVWIRKLFLQIP